MDGLAFDWYTCVRQWEGSLYEIDWLDWFRWERDCEFVGFMFGAGKVPVFGFTCKTVIVEVLATLTVILPDWIRFWGG